MQRIHIPASTAPAPSSSPTWICNLIHWRNWHLTASIGDVAIYHRGNIARDRKYSEDLRERAEQALLFQQIGVLQLTLKRIEDFDALYYCSRISVLRGPKGILQGSINAAVYRALKILDEPDKVYSAYRNLSREMSISECEAAVMIRHLQIREIVTVEKNRRVEITPLGRRLMQQKG